MREKVGCETSLGNNFKVDIVLVALSSVLPGPSETEKLAVAGQCSA